MHRLLYGKHIAALGQGSRERGREVVKEAGKKRRGREEEKVQGRREGAGKKRRGRKEEKGQGIGD